MHTLLKFFLRAHNAVKKLTVVSRLQSESKPLCGQHIVSEGNIAVVGN